MGLQGGNRPLHGNHLPQPCPADVRQRQIRPGAVLQGPVFLIAGVGKLHQLSAVGGQYGDGLVPNRLLKAVDPVVAMNQIRGVIGLQIFPIAQGPLLHHLIHAGNALKHGPPLLKGQQRKPLIAGHRLIGENADDEPSQALRLPDNGNVPAVEHIRGKAHVHRPALHLPQAVGHNGQILRVVHLGAEHVPNIQRAQGALGGHPVERRLRVALDLARLTEGGDLSQPDPPLLFPQQIQRLGGHRVGKKLHANLCNQAVPQNRLEILLGKRDGGTHRRAAAAAFQHRVQHGVFQHQIAVQQENIPCQILSCKVDGVDVIGLPVVRIFDKRDAHRQFQILAVLLYHTVERPCGDDNFGDSRLRQHPQLTAENRLPGGDLRETFRLAVCQRRHAGTHARIQNQCFHNAAPVAVNFGRTSENQLSSAGKCAKICSLSGNERPVRLFLCP